MQTTLCSVYNYPTCTCCPMCRLYEPVIFRAFGAANADVRRNALLLMLDAFPIRVGVQN